MVRGAEEERGRPPKRTNTSSTRSSKTYVPSTSRSRTRKAADILGGYQTNDSDAAPSLAARSWRLLTGNRAKYAARDALEKERREAEYRELSRNALESTRAWVPFHGEEKDIAAQTLEELQAQNALLRGRLKEADKCIVLSRDTMDQQYKRIGAREEGVIEMQAQIEVYARLRNTPVWRTLLATALCTLLLSGFLVATSLVNALSDKSSNLARFLEQGKWAPITVISIACGCTLLGLVGLSCLWWFRDRTGNDALWLKAYIFMPALNSSIASAITLVMHIVPRQPRIVGMEDWGLIGATGAVMLFGIVGFMYHKFWVVPHIFGRTDAYERQQAREKKLRDARKQFVENFVKDEKASEKRGHRDLEKG